jgi:dTDP-glucose 4,6-dehydratase
MQKSIDKILVTGAAGFIGSQFVRQSVKKNYSLVGVDKLTYAGDLERLKDVGKEIKFYKVDICDHKKLHEIFKK